VTPSELTLRTRLAGSRHLPALMAHKRALTRRRALAYRCFCTRRQSPSMIISEGCPAAEAIPDRDG
jgi:hypothetical protein